MKHFIVHIYNLTISEIKNTRIGMCSQSEGRNLKMHCPPDMHLIVAVPTHNYKNFKQASDHIHHALQQCDKHTTSSTLNSPPAGSGWLAAIGWNRIASSIPNYSLLVFCKWNKKAIKSGNMFATRISYFMTMHEGQHFWMGILTYLKYRVQSWVLWNEANVLPNM